MSVMPPNGDAPVQGVPPDILWDDDNPPFVHACSNHVEHHPQCNGMCDGRYLTESETALQNEALAWARLGMNPRGLPAVMQGAPYPGLLVEIWDLELKFEVLREWLLDTDQITLEELDERFRSHKLNKMRTIREQHEVEIRRQRVVSSLGIVQKPPLLGPDGNPVG